MNRQDDPRQISIPGTEARVPPGPAKVRKPQAPAASLPLFRDLPPSAGDTCS